MKVVILSTFEQVGGAAIAANRLMKALRKSGVEAKMLVRDKQTDDPNVISVNSSMFARWINKIRFVWERSVIFVHNRLKRENLFTISIANTGIDISKHPIIKAADIIHLHWINQGFLSIDIIYKIVKLGKPVVWTMHDQWTYTGICHYTSGCDKYLSHCSLCQKLYAPSKRDLSDIIFNKKQQLYINSAITFVGCSHWVAEEALSSTLCKKSSVYSIPNPIDTSQYKPTDKSLARKDLNLPDEQCKLILFGACKITDERKGLTYLKQSCDILKNKYGISSKKVSLVVFGGGVEELSSIFPFEIHNVGYINNAELMIKLYNAVDLFAVPSLEDNLPNTIMEAMACGTPCVGFQTGGIPEMIDHLQTGYVAEYKNAQDLAKGIYWVLNESVYEELSDNTVNKVQDKYSEVKIARQYNELYKKMIDV